MPQLPQTQNHAPALSAFFAATFTASEGPDEGRLIGELVRNLLTSTPDADIRLFTMENLGESLGENPGEDTGENSGRILAAGIFTRLTYPEDRRRVFLLSPMAVATAHQRQGIGQGLLRSALAALKAEGIDCVFTYGDPKYYSRVGFQPMTEDQARAPLPLSLPHGWLGQSLRDAPLQPLCGPSFCVAALARPEFW